MKSQEDFKAFYNGNYDSGPETERKNILDYMYHTGTNAPARTEYNKNTTYLSFGFIQNLLISEDNSVWGIMRYNNGGSSSTVFCQLLDGTGKRDFMIPTPFLNKIVQPNSFQMNSGYFYFSADISTSGTETGFHKVYRFRTSAMDNVDDLFRYIERNADRIELESYSIGGNELYFSGFQGTKNVTGKINLSTQAYTELNFGWKVTTILSY
jgi:hypothetical protein